MTRTINHPSQQALEGHRVWPFSFQPHARARKGKTVVPLVHWFLDGSIPCYIRHRAGTTELNMTGSALVPLVPKWGRN